MQAAVFDSLHILIIDRSIDVRMNLSLTGFKHAVVFPCTEIMD